VNDPWAPKPNPLDADRIAEQRAAADRYHGELAARPWWRKATNGISDFIEMHRIGLAIVGVFGVIGAMWLSIAWLTR
jgi:hypothetical protein